MRPDEIIDAKRRELVDWLSASDCPQHEVEAEAERMLTGELARSLSSAMQAMSCVDLCLSYREPGSFDAIRRELWNWQ